MTITSHGSGPGPVPIATVLSDRAHEEIAPAVAASPGDDPLSRALMTLDRVTGELSDEAATASRGSHRRQEILDAAAALFAEFGYHGTSLRDISRRVGISHPGMLHHFSSKPALLGAVVDLLEEHAQQVIDRLDELVASPQAVRELFEGELAPTDDRVKLLATLTSECVSHDHPARFRAVRLRRVHEHIQERIFTGLGENGLLREGVDPSFASRMVVSLLLSLSVRESTIRSVQPDAQGPAGPDLQRTLDLILVDPVD